MIQHLLLGLLLVAVAAVSVLLLEALMRRPELGAAFLLGATLLSATLDNDVPAVTLPSGIRVQVHDAAFALLLAAGILRMLRMQRLTSLQRWVLLLCVMMLLSLVRGAVKFGAQPAIGEFNDRLIAEGYWVFAGGLADTDAATVVDNRGEQAVLTDGPFVESKEYLAGFWVWDVPDLDVALKLAAEASKVCDRKIEVRPFR